MVITATGPRDLSDPSLNGSIEHRNRERNRETKNLPSKKLFAESGRPNQQPTKTIQLHLVFPFSEKNQASRGALVTPRSLKPTIEHTTRAIFIALCALSCN